MQVIQGLPNNAELSRAACFVHQSAVEGTEQIVFIVQMDSHKSHFTAFCTNNISAGGEMSSAKNKYR